MKYLEIFYGGQYQELADKGKDGNAARFNGNLLLSAFLLLLILVIIAFLFTFSAEFSQSATRFLRHIFGRSSGKIIGQLLALPLFLLLYFAVSTTVGNEQNFKKIIHSFLQYPEEERKKASMKIIVPFLALIGVFLFLALFSLKR